MEIGIHGGGGPQVGKVTCFGGVENNPPLHAILQPRHPWVQTTCFGVYCFSTLTCWSCCKLQCCDFLLLPLGPVYMKVGDPRKVK